MAATNPLLMTVILAIATLHHSRVNNHRDHLEAMAYHGRSLSLIRSSLSNAEDANDDCILVSTTILHLYDGLESKYAIKAC